MSIFFFICFLFLFPIGLIVGLIRPQLFNKLFRGNATRKKTSILFGAAMLVSLIISISTTPRSDAPTAQQQIEDIRAKRPPKDVSVAPPTPEVVTPAPQPPATPQIPPPAPALVAESDDKLVAQKELDEIIALSKKAELISSYEFSNKANVVYVDSAWYGQKVSFKKDMMAKIAILKKRITGYQHFVMRDAYTDEKVAEVTAFSGSLEVYK